MLNLQKGRAKIKILIGINCGSFINWGMRMIFLFVFASFSVALQGQNMTAQELLDKSIQFHDPMGRWQTSEMEMVLKMETPNRPGRTSLINIDNSKGSFGVQYVSKGHLVNYKVDPLDSAEVFADFMPATGRTDIDSLDLSPDRARRWRNYYSYLYGLPMKLKDAGTHIDSEVRQDSFNGEDVLAIRVTYEAEVGSDIWYFYFHPNTYAMVGYRFYHDESINDGEYIVLDGMEIQNGLRIPKHRYWYINEDAKFLGADMMISLQVK